MRPDAGAAGGGELRSMAEGSGDAAMGTYGSVELPKGPAPPMPRRGLPKNQAEAKDMAFDALETAKADVRSGLSDLPALLAPWLLFTLCFVPIALLAETTGAYCAFALASMIVTGFLLFSYGRAWKALAFACLVAGLLGGYMGYYNRWKYLYPYFIYSRSPYHSDVLPSDFPDAYRDAGYLTFSADSHVDTSKGLGYRSGELWCVAPILGRQTPKGGLEQRRASFWAVGKDCCTKRGSFECGHAWRDVAHGGLVVFDVGRDGDPVVPTYKLAIAAAAHTYDLVVPDDPILVSWATQPDTAIPEIYSSAVSFVWTALALMLGIIPLLSLAFACLGLSLTRRDDEASETWHVEEFEQMIMSGQDFSGQTYSRELQLGLMNGRCYWSGEVIYDYMFHLANKHMYIGCIFSHPAHPYAKWERICVAILVSLFIIFPVTAISVKFGQYSSTRTLFLLLFVTLPRNVLKLYMIQIAQQDTLLELEEGRDAEDDITKMAFQWEVSFLFGATMVCAATCAICASYIMSAATEPLGVELMYNCDGLGFAAIMEPLIDMVAPYVGLDDYAGTWTFGFFGRWRHERDHFVATGVAMDFSPDMRRLRKQQQAGEERPFGLPNEPGAAEAALAAAAAGPRPGSIGRLDLARPLFRDAGTEILLDPEARKTKRRTKTACGRIAKDACGADWWNSPRRAARDRQARGPFGAGAGEDPFATQPSDPGLAH